jgi:hypothetical protein
MYKQSFPTLSQAKPEIRMYQQQEVETQQKCVIEAFRPIFPSISQNSTSINAKQIKAKVPSP